MASTLQGRKEERITAETTTSESPLIRLRRNVWVPATLKTAFVATVSTWNAVAPRREVLQSARHDARAAFSDKLLQLALGLRAEWRVRNGE
jgi:hypothetical protein